MTECFLYTIDFQYTTTPFIRPIHQDRIRPLKTTKLIRLLTFNNQFRQLIDHKWSMTSLLPIFRLARHQSPSKLYSFLVLGSGQDFHSPCACAKIGNGVEKKNGLDTCSFGWIPLYDPSIIRPFF